jgi:hypothetical protein
MTLFGEHWQLVRMIDLLFEIFVKTLLVIPDAFIRWMFDGFSGSFQKKLETTNWIGNSIIGGTVLGLNGIIIYNL